MHIQGPDVHVKCQVSDTCASSKIKSWSSKSKHHHLLPISWIRLLPCKKALPITFNTNYDLQFNGIMETYENSAERTSDNDIGVFNHKKPLLQSNPYLKFQFSKRIQNINMEIKHCCLFPLNIAKTNPSRAHSTRTVECLPHCNQF